MKIKRIIRIAIIIFILINIKNISYGKYVFEYAENAVNIELIKPDTFKVNIIEQQNTNTGYEWYANNTHEITVKIKVDNDNEIIADNSKEPIILVGTEEVQCIKETNIIEKGENYIIYEIKMSQITGNGQLILKLSRGYFGDVVGNKMSEKTLDTGIKIDNISPEVEYNQEILENKKALIKITSNEEFRELDGWQNDESNLFSAKEFIHNIKYKKDIYDFAGNKTELTIQIKGANYFEFDFLAYVTDIGWLQPDYNRIEVPDKQNSNLKIEAMAFRTGDNVEKDYLLGGGFIYSHWGKRSYGISKYTGHLYKYGTATSMSMASTSEIVTIDDKQYVQIGGEGMNIAGTTDKNGNNPIPEDIAKQNLYGLARPYFRFSSDKGYSIIYQQYFGKKWGFAGRDGEIPQPLYVPIQGMRISIVPSSEAEDVVNYWNQDEGNENVTD